MEDDGDDLGLGYRVDGQVATLTLSRPGQRNCQTPRLWEAMARIGESMSSGVRIAVIRGQGASFSAGLDMQMFSRQGIAGRQGIADGTSIFDLVNLDNEGFADRIATFQRAFAWCRRSELITIAAVQGHAIGAGFQLALACDLRVCADDVRFAMREASLGLVPDLGGTQPLVELVGYSRALEICVTGRFVDAEEAGQLGLATIVVPRAELDAAVADLCAAVLTPGHQVVTATKRLLAGAGSRSYEEQLVAERWAQVERLRSPVTPAAQPAAAGHHEG